MTNREKFEWCCTNGKPEINDLGCYCDPNIEERWIGWQACAVNKKAEINMLVKMLEQRYAPKDKNERN